MLLKVLGTAAGGGVPQWNCACPGCSGARAHPQWRRRHASLAVRADDDHWYLINATPDIAEQMESTPALHPGPGARRTPVAGLVLTDAELDHTLGIARLREGDRIEVLATGPVRTALRGQAHLDDILTPYTKLVWRELGSRPVPLCDGSDVEISALPVSAKRPRYAAGGGGADGSPTQSPTRCPTQSATQSPTDPLEPWVVALRLHDRRTGGTAVYAPALAAWPEPFRQALADADCVLLDGTFWDDDEPRRGGFSARTATGMGHLPIDGPDGTLHRLAPLTARCFYTHLNNTNPLVDPEAPQHKRLAEHGLAVAAEGMEIAL
ncbi:pyrroloquinoline quinone biosynthesis protein PqqB [Streptomyces piniterrae]|uniref:Coenzyme PQQ synthesis protein B n=1 Tax=Streptomyces piniterrae TaxID=2571125 RepID=A0A4U0NWM2_9ACTN|nr:pyrroloquinoline quinone biosynthesis protein PqqB [Streptomyces piniterrae]TJZ59175.1 pyrroloquinoline quinone biosynthesis protein PqqB [Streptomyces piniterrae]